MGVVVCDVGAADGLYVDGDIWHTTAVGRNHIAGYRPGSETQRRRKVASTVTRPGRIDRRQLSIPFGEHEPVQVSHYELVRVINACGEIFGLVVGKLNVRL
jgi:hypothetical protein